MFPGNLQTEFKSSYRQGMLNWEEPGFMSFAIGFLNLLEPVVFESGQVITEENSSSPSLVFILKGSVELGYVRESKVSLMINPAIAPKYVMGLGPGNTVGVEALIDLKSLFHYRCSLNSHHVDGLFIRRVNWVRFALSQNQVDHTQNNFLQHVFEFKKRQAQIFLKKVIFRIQSTQVFGKDSTENAENLKMELLKREDVNKIKQIANAQFTPVVKYYNLEDLTQHMQQISVKIFAKIKK